MELLKILVVEDEPIIAEILEETLKDAGFEVVVAATAEAGLAILTDTADVRGLVADVGLPGAASGWDLARAARAISPNLAVVYATGHGETEWPSEGVPGSVLLTKPYAPAQVVLALAGQLNTDTPN